MTPSMANISTDQALCIADQQHLLEHLTNQLTQAGDERGDGGEVRAAVAAQSDEGDVLAARTLDAAAGDDAARVGQQHDLQEHGRRVGTRTDLVVVKARVERAQVDLAVEQVVQRVLEGAGQQLRLEIDGQKPRAGVDVLVAGHLGLVQYRPITLATGVPERQTRRIFYSLVR